MTWPRMDGLRTLELGTPGELRQELVGLVLSGHKRATAGLLSDYEIEGEALEFIGEQLVLIGDDGRRVGLVEITGLDVVPFAEVTDDFAVAEGRGSPVAWTGRRRTARTGSGSAAESTIARRWSACASNCSEPGRWHSGHSGGSGERC